MQLQLSLSSSALIRLRLLLLKDSGEALLKQGSFLALYFCESELVGLTWYRVLLLSLFLFSFIEFVLGSDMLVLSQFSSKGFF